MNIITYLKKLRIKILDRGKFGKHQNGLPFVELVIPILHYLFFETLFVKKCTAV